MKKIVPFVIFLVMIFSGSVTAVTLVKVEVAVLAPGMSDTVVVELDQEFILNGKIRQKALLVDYDETYDNLVIQLSDIRENGGIPEAFLRISALKSEFPVRLSISGIREGSREDCFGARLKVLDFISDGENYVAAKFVVEKEKTLGEVLAETIITLIFG